VVQGNLHRTNREPRKAAEILNAQVNATLMNAQDPEKRCPEGVCKTRNSPGKPRNTQEHPGTPMPRWPSMFSHVNKVE